MGKHRFVALLRNHSAGNSWGKMESKFSGLALKVANGSFLEELFVGFVAGLDVSLAIFKDAVEEPG